MRKDCQNYGSSWCADFECEECPVMDIKTERGRTMRDECLTRLDTIMPLIHRENHAQIDKWGVQEHTAMEWYVILAEEAGELAKAMLEEHYDLDHATPQAVVKEAIQTATLALKLAEMYLVNIYKRPADPQELYDWIFSKGSEG